VLHPDALGFCPADGTVLPPPPDPTTEPESAPEPESKRAPAHTVLGMALSAHEGGRKPDSGDFEATRVYVAAEDEKHFGPGPAAPPPPPSQKASARPSLASAPRSGSAAGRAASIALRTTGPQPSPAPAPPPAPSAPSVPAPAPPAPSAPPTPVAPPTSAASPAAATPAAKPTDAAALPTSLRDAFAKGPWDAEQAVARLAVVADAVAMRQTQHHGTLTPVHVRFASADATGKPTLVAEAAAETAYAALYRPPEMKDASAVGPAADVYNLGCMLFEALTGKAPFRGNTPDEVAKKHTTVAAPAVRMVRRDCALPSALELELQRALKKRPGDRHPNAQEFAQAIRAAVRDDDRATMSLSGGEAAFLQNLLAGKSEQEAMAAAQKVTAGFDVARAQAAKKQGGVAGSELGVAQARKAVVAEAVPAPAPAPSGAKTGLIVGGSIAVVVGAVVVWLVLGQKEEPPPPAPAAPAHTEQVASPPPVAVAVPPPAMAPDVAEPDAAEDIEPDTESDAPDVAAEPKKGAKKPSKPGQPAATPQPAPPKPPPKKDGPITF
jgi:hypothetical protein